jgi:hypothetical protein
MKRTKHYILVIASLLMLLTAALTTCDRGGSDVGVTPYSSGEGRVGEGNGTIVRAVVLRAITIMPSNALGINPGSRLQFAATGVYADDSELNLTEVVTWASSDPSVATISNEPDSKGLSTAVSRGSCGISATLGDISGSTTIRVNE